MYQLTNQEIRVLELICRGYNSKEIGEKLFKSPRTIEGYRARLYEKLEVKNKAELIACAFRNDLLK